MAEMGTEPDSESKIWRLTGTRIRSLIQSRIRLRNQFFWLCRSLVRSILVNLDRLHPCTVD